MRLTTALAHLLSEAALREAYRQDRWQAARRLSIRKSDLGAFLAIDPVALEKQAQALLNKRFHEVSRLLPETFSRLGQETRGFFATYAKTLWPRGYTRHLQDAYAFCQYLHDQGVRGVSRAEFNRLAFILDRRRLAVHLVSDLRAKGRLRRALQILYRGRDRCPRQFALYLLPWRQRAQR